MIVTVGTAPARLTGASGPERAVRCLARRGMLHSECQAVDHVRLAGGDRFDLVEADGHETAWVLCRGRASLDGEPGELTGGDVILVPAGCRAGLNVLSGPLDLLRVAVLTGDTAAQLPQRRPVA